MRSLKRLPQDRRINGEWFIDLDKFVDVDRFEGLHRQIARGIAMASMYIEPVVIGSLPSQFDMRVPEVEQVGRSQTLNDPVYKELVAAGASRQMLYDYVKYGYVSAALGKKILLRTYTNYHGDFGKKHLAAVNSTQAAAMHFPELMSFIDDLNIFDEVGRVIIFLTERNVGVDVHCDYADRKTRKDQFLWLSPKTGKKFFVLDKNFEKHYFTGTANTFDNTAWHGSDPVPYATYSIRIDGLFNERFLNETGLHSHFSPVSS